MSGCFGEFSCAHCHTQSCKSNEGAYPDFCPTANLPIEKIDAVLNKIKGSRKIGKISRVAAEIEGLFYCQMTRVEETVEFIQRMGVKKVGIATCIGLIKETRLLTKIFDKKGIEYVVVCCKVGAIDKGAIGIEDEFKVGRGTRYESMCNPILQAELLNEEKTDMNIIMGLCCGHDMLFNMHSKAPVTTLVVKDRVLCHNPAAALYASDTMYSRFKS